MVSAIGSILVHALATNNFTKTQYDLNMEGATNNFTKTHYDLNMEGGTTFLLDIL
jgi:hypothetical protein